MSEVEIREPTIKEACENCKFFSGSNECVRRSPVRGDATGYGVFPRMLPLDWCGEYQRKQCDHVWDAEHVPDHSKPGVRQPACSKCGAVQIRYYDAHAKTLFAFGRSLLNDKIGQ